MNSVDNEKDCEFLNIALSSRSDWILVRRLCARTGITRAITFNGCLVQDRQSLPPDQGQYMGPEQLSK